VVGGIATIAHALQRSERAAGRAFEARVVVDRTADDLGDDVTTTARHDSPGAKTGAVVHWPGRYDLLIWLLTFGRERRFRERLLEPARLRAGESVLDVGCGTGTLAIAAKRHVGSTGPVCGIDASPEMIERAIDKARKAGVEIAFETAFAQSLPFPDGRFDVALSTVMLHHLPRQAREECVAEIRRVLKPGGRLLVVDFAGASRRGKGPLVHFHRRGHVEPRALVDLVSGAGLQVVESGAVGRWDLYFVIGQNANLRGGIR
jgi:ubiquinone/menaquinone biosynthesis C-methylase UbiE